MKRYLAKARPFVEEIIPIEEHPVQPAAAYLRTLIENAHDRWLWSKVAQNNWELRYPARSSAGRIPAPAMAGRGGRVPSPRQQSLPPRVDVAGTQSAMAAAEPPGNTTSFFPG